MIMNIPPKTLTLDLMETLDLCYLSLLSSNASYRKMKRIKLVAKLQIYKFGSVHFWYIILPMKLHNSQKKVQSLYEVQS